MLAAGCDRVAPTAPYPDLAAAVPVAPPPYYRFWWRMVEACAGRRGDINAVRFAVVPNAEELTPIDGEPVGGVYLPGERTIIIAGALARSGELVRHEMLHALLGSTVATDHPYEYFGRRCAAFAGCGETGPCAREVAATAPPPPADPRDVLTSALAVTAEALPGPTFAADSNGGAFAVVVTARNPFPYPVRVGPSDPVPPGFAALPGFGFELRPSFREVGPFVPRVVVLRPGEATRRVFDLTTTAAGWGSWRIFPDSFDLVGRFGAALSPPVALRIGPPRAAQP